MFSVYLPGSFVSCYLQVDFVKKDSIKKGSSLKLPQSHENN